jgi:hypothetical protein
MGNPLPQVPFRLLLKSQLRTIVLPLCLLYLSISSTSLSPLPLCLLYLSVSSTSLSPLPLSLLYLSVSSTSLSPLPLLSSLRLHLSSTSPSLPSLPPSLPLSSIFTHLLTSAHTKNIHSVRPPTALLPTYLLPHLETYQRRPPPYLLADLLTCSQRTHSYHPPICLHTYLAYTHINSVLPTTPSFPRLPSNNSKEVACVPYQIPPLNLPYPTLPPPTYQSRSD